MSTKIIRPSPSPLHSPSLSSSPSFHLHLSNTGPEADNADAAGPGPTTLRRLRERSTSPSSSSASPRSVATSYNDLGDMPSIDQVRPMYERLRGITLDGNGSAEEGMGDEAHMGAGSVPHGANGSGRGGQSEERSRTRPRRSSPTGSIERAKGDKEGNEEEGVTVQKRRFPEEEEEDLLRESNDRFVLFPIKYREVSHASHSNGPSSV
jgi:ribonucleoside-diphosphate reductase subunit M2